jgi:chitin disaccharide deacetylase
MTTRHLIVNADDLGYAPAVNDGIFAAHRDGIVTSTSLMVLRDAATAAIEALPAHPDLAVGLHLERRSSFGGHMPTKGRTPDVECRKQLERFRALVGREPTHLDSHKHVHETDTDFGAAAEALAAELGVPLRNRGIRYERRFYGRDAISPAHLAALIEALPPGWTEIGCHPAAGPVPISSYDAERRIELATLRDPGMKSLLNVSDVQLCSFAQVDRR